MLIYKITNNVNGKIYIGKTTVDLHRRKINHKCSMNTGSQMAIHRAMRKYGFEKFSWEILFECENVEDLDQAEVDFIFLYDTRNTVVGYNVAIGGGGVGVGELHPWFGCHHTDEVKKILSDKKLGCKNPRWGKPGTCLGRRLTKEQKMAVGVLSSQRRASLKTRLKMSQQRTGEKNSFYGKQHSFKAAFEIGLSKSKCPVKDDLLKRSDEVLVDVKHILFDNPDGLSLRSRHLLIRDKYWISRTMIGKIRKGSYGN